MDKRDDILTDERPWGRFTQYAFNEQCTVKVIEVEPGAALSLQKHASRDEMWVMLDDGLTITLDGVDEVGTRGQVFWVPRGTIHRVSVAGDTGGRFLEIAFGEFDEDDIVRLEDRYGRTADPA